MKEDISELVNLGLSTNAAGRLAKRGITSLEDIQRVNRGHRWAAMGIGGQMKRSIEAVIEANKTQNHQQNHTEEQNEAVIPADFLAGAEGCALLFKQHKSEGEFMAGFKAALDIMMKEGPDYSAGAYMFATLPPHVRDKWLDQH